MSKFDVRAMNLNLLPALEALLIEGSVGAAARRVHVSQSAMSHSLARLREIFRDPILTPSGRTMVRTPLAERLSAHLSSALDRLEEAVATAPVFDPKTSERAFRIATFDYFELTVLPDLLETFRRVAPNVRLEIERFTPSKLPALVSGEVDLALVGEAPLPPHGLRRASVGEEPFAVIARPGHPRIRKRLNLGLYVELGHILVSVEGRRDGAVDRALAKQGKSRRVVLRVPHFTSAPLAVMRSDHICTIARGVAERARELFGVRVFPPPLSIPPAPLVAYWSRRTEEDPGTTWLRNLILAPRSREV